MLARLWWKEWRLFWPAMLILAVADLGFQWLLLEFGGDDMKSGGLTWVALAWSLLYAFAAGSAAFSGERESKTLGFLDALPVPRSTLWLGKASFAIATTCVLGVTLAFAAAMGTESGPKGVNAYDVVLPDFASLMVEAVAWGLFWSSLLRNPMAAAVLAVTCVGVLYLPHADDSAADFTYRWFGAGAAMAASGLIMAWRPRRFVRIERVHIPRPPVEPRRLDATVGRSLAWQAFREGWTTWALMMVVGLMVPVAGLMTGTLTQGVVETLLATVASLLAGVAVFGTENASGTRRFLHHQGVGPGQAWGGRMLVWAFGIAAFLGALVFVETRPEYRFVPNDNPLGLVHSPVTVGALVLDGFGVGMLCGMAFRRRMTAGLISVVAIVALVPIQVGLSAFGIIPSWALYASPLILLAISRAWAGDWLADREGWRPWAKLGLSLAVPFSLMVASYVGFRAWGVPEAEAVFVPSTDLPPPTDRDAAVGYQAAYAATKSKAGDSIYDQHVASTVAQDVARAIQEGWRPQQASLVAYLEKNRAAIDLARKASTLPRAWFGSPNTVGYDNSATGPNTMQFRTLATLLALEARERQAKGDLAGAWEDILAEYRMARHLTTPSPTYIQLLVGATIHHEAVGLAEEWACDPKQTLDVIRKARAELAAIPEVPTAVEAIKIESGIIDRTLAKSAEELSGIYYADNRGRDTSILGRVIFNGLVAAPWERERARRITRRIFADEVRDFAIDPWQRTKGKPSAVLSEEARGCPLVRVIAPNSESVAQLLDRERAGRRMLDQVLALRSWQFSHDGKYPDSLQALVPSELSGLPVDPFSGRAYGYVVSRGQLIRPPAIDDRTGSGDIQSSVQPGRRMIYSVGPDGVDDHAERSFSFYDRSRTGDLIIALP